MGKFYKAALVLFYLLQLVIVFHEQVMNLFESAASPIHDSASSQESRNGFLKKLQRAMGQHHAADVVLHSEQRTHRISAVLHRTEEPDQEVHHEEKNSAGRKQRTRRLPEFLIANLFPLFKKKRSRLAGKHAARHIDLSRFITYPSSEKSAQAA